MMTMDVRDTRVYPVMIVTAVVVGLAVQYVLNTRRGIRRNVAGVMTLACAFFSVAGGILLTLITSGGKLFGLSSLGGLVGMYAAAGVVALITKQPYYGVILAQNCTFVLPLMYGISKLGCFGAGCCRGMGYHGFGAVTYLTEAGECTVLPVQLLEALSFFALFVLGMVLYQKKFRRAAHLVFFLSMLVKFALDFLRGSHTGVILSQTQVFCLVLMAADAVWMLWNSRRKPAAFPMEKL